MIEHEAAHIGDGFVFAVSGLWRAGGLGQKLRARKFITSHTYSTFCDQGVGACSFMDP